MRKRTLTKGVALLLCFAFVSLAVPNLIRAERKAPKIDIRLLWEKPLSFFSSFFPILSPIFAQNKKSKEVRNTSNSSRMVVPMGSTPIAKPSDEK